MSQQALSFVHRDSFPPSVISPALELGAYESLWAEQGMTLKKLSELFRDSPAALPSEIYGNDSKALQMAVTVLNMIRDRGVTNFGLRIHRAGEYPRKLRDAKNPLELLYFQGAWELVETQCVAVVGTREPSTDGIRRARKIAQALVADGKTIVSGLAYGVDTEAHRTAIDSGGRTIAVIGTPIGEYYPAENRALQKQIERDFLLISQVPVFRHSQQTPQYNRLFFPERNVTMSALTEATVIIEAGDTSGTLIQARAALDQGRKLFILDSCFNRGLKWPDKFLSRGAIRVRDYEDIAQALQREPQANQD